MSGPATRVSGRAALSVVGRVFLVLGLVALAIALTFALIERGAGRTASATGTIVAFAPNAVVAFDVPDGRTVQVTTSVRSTTLRLGDRMDVAYDPARPEDGRLDGMVGRWFAAGLAGIFGVCFTLVGLGLSLAGRLSGPRA